MSPTKHEPRSGSRVYEERWERAATRGAQRREPSSVVGRLDGDWRVERLTGPVPMPFVWKRIRAGRGTTRVSPPLRRARGPLFEPELPFRLEQREGHVALIYLGPLSFLVDELRLEEDGSWLGRANVAGVRYAWFRMVPA
ncbi:MAG: hypothetical protein AVDCRST_MAG78-611 [uncultured Rubrobacteraceae bacterium]|uniref:Lipocalin-like domain-containing protein n=1 Tax=uncultured Rubrobacteraceae bacterium TaxID=349277 RepID=A0A6J4PFT9_9ACTN|nr:MAG: hypothetical protein AVDCRST_MAG78-611 [uncultured Rubrobacteraceae bacterium]